MAEPTVTEVADLIADSLDGEYHDGLGYFVGAMHAGGGSQERLVEIVLSDGGSDERKFTVLVREAE
ncbi:hypothetical protein [Promicromonospora kroppenstedtii]|uniref:hypothetical protein n=1 Tax=Promicromonospora kroppenstedtii TaxID=440482 RepID=UPI0004B95EEC|nr:hypothetical protein [Promicromonospora kroppenstedtii]